MKKIIFTAFALGLTTSVFATEDLDKLYSFGAEDIETTGSQPQVGNSRTSDAMNMMTDNNNYSWYEQRNGN